MENTKYTFTYEELFEREDLIKKIEEDKKLIMDYFKFWQMLRIAKHFGIDKMDELTIEELQILHEVVSDFLSFEIERIIQEGLSGKKLHELALDPTWKGREVQ